MPMKHKAVIEQNKGDSAISPSPLIFLTIPADIITAIPWFYHLLPSLLFVDKSNHI